MATTRRTIEPVNPEELYTVSAGGYSATADAFARKLDSGELWFLSMVGPQTALKAIWASLLKQPPEAAHLIRGADGGELSPGTSCAAQYPITPSAPGPPRYLASPPRAAGMP